MKSESLMPLARRHDLLIQRLPEETLVYDLVTHQAHCLNRTAALVWGNCDGKTTLGEMAMLLARETGGNPDTAQVRHALADLAAARLVETGGAGTINSISRRAALKGLGKAAAAGIPLVSTILVPEAAQAASNLPNGSPCTASAQCASGCCRKTDFICRPVGQGACL
ncbi:MAG: PqqD family peptide modification chaperone [Blastocatellia bacterium]